jgi:hypothetical protein
MKPRSPDAADLRQAARPDVKLQERRPVCRGRERVFAPFDSCRLRRTLLAYNFQLFVLAVACVLAGQHPALAAQSVNVVNQTAQSLYVSFSGSGPITWDASCQGTMMGVVIAPGGFCGATVESTNSGSRFCASPNAPLCRRGPSIRPLQKPDPASADANCASYHARRRELASESGSSNTERSGAGLLGGLEINETALRQQVTLRRQKHCDPLHQATRRRVEGFAGSCQDNRMARQGGASRLTR